MSTDSTDLVPIPVPGTDRQIMATSIDGRPLVSVRHACDSIGVEPARQIQKLNTRSWATVYMTPTVAADGKKRELAMIDRRTFTMWLATIDTNRVSAEARPVVEAFQAEAADALDAYFSGEVVVAPKNQPTTIDGIRAMLDQIEAAQNDAARANARIDAIEGRHEWFAALGYARLNNLATDEPSLRRLGQKASAIARSHDIAANRVQHGHYGYVNQFPAWVWDLAIQELS